MLVALAEAHRSDEQAEINALGEAGREAVAGMVRPVFPTLADRLVNNGKARGIRASLHCDRLAIDLVFRDEHGDVIACPSSLGDWWEKQHPLARWGGRFGDPPHFSFEFGGRK